MLERLDSLAGLVGLNFGQVLDGSIVLAYLIFALYIGIKSGRDIKTFKEFALSDRKFSTPFMVATLFATAIGASSFLSRSERIFTSGVIYLIIPMARPIFTYLTGKLISHRMHRFSGLMSTGHIMGKLYGIRGQVTMGVASIFDSIGSTAGQVAAMGFLFNYFLGISFELGVFIGYAIVVIYTAFGGVKAVITTDFLQFIFTLIILPLILVGVLIYINDLYGMNGYFESAKVVFNNIPSSHLNPFSNKKDVLLYSSLSLVMILSFFDGPLGQRMLITKSARQSRRAMFISGALFLVLNLLLGFVVLISHAIIPSTDSNAVFMEIMDKVLPMGLKGVAIAGLVAAVMSTADSCISVVGVSVVNDLIIPLKKTPLSEKAQLVLAKVITALAGLGSVLLALYLRNLFEIWSFVLLFIGPMTAPQLLFGFFHREGSSKTFMISAVAGIVVTAFWKIFMGHTHIHAALPGIIANAVAFLLARKFLDKLTWNNTINGEPIPDYNVHNPYDRSSSEYRKQTMQSWMTYIKEEGFVKFLRISSSLSFSLYASQHITFSALAIISYVGGVFLVPDGVVIKYTDQLVLRMLIGLMSVCLILRFYWDNRLLKYFSSLFFVNIALCLVILPTYWLLQSGMSEYWILNVVMCNLLLSVLVDSKMFAFIYVVGVLIACGFFQLFVGIDFDALHNPITAAHSIIFSLLFSTVFSAKRETVFKEKLFVLRQLALKLKRSVDTPAVNSYNICKETIDLVHDLKNCYGDVPNIMRYIHPIRKSLYSIRENLHSVNSVVTMMCINLEGIRPGTHKGFVYTSVLDEIEKALQMDIIKEGLRRCHVEVVVEKDLDFYAPSDNKAVLYMTMNLLKNSIERAEFFRTITSYSRIDVWIEKASGGWNEIHVRDYYGGIDPDIEEEMFNKFFDGNTSTGLGLAYCQNVMRYLDGYMTSNTVLGRSAEFVLHFPDMESQIEKAQNMWPARFRAGSLKDKERKALEEEKRRRYSSAEKEKP